MKKVAVVGTQCVACGTCQSKCNKGAISVYKGMQAVIDGNKCVGCGKCIKICPASVVFMEEWGNL